MGGHARARRSLTRSRRSSAQQRTSPAPVTLGSQELHPLYLVILCHALRGPGKGCGVIGELTLVNHVAHRVEKPVKSHPSKARDCLTLCCHDLRGVRVSDVMSEHEPAQTVDLPVPPDLTGRADGEFSSLINRPLLPANPTETARIGSQWLGVASTPLTA